MIPFLRNFIDKQPMARKFWLRFINTHLPIPPLFLNAREAPMINMLRSSIRLLTALATRQTLVAVLFAVTGFTFVGCEPTNSTSVDRQLTSSYLSYGSTDNCYRGGDDYLPSAIWEYAANACGTNLVFGHGETLSVTFGDSGGFQSFPVNPSDTTFLDHIYSVWAMYLYGKGYQKLSGGSGAVNAGYRLIGWKKIPDSDTSVSKLSLKIDLPINADAVFLLGYIGWCDTSSIDGQTCALNSVMNNSPSISHDEPFLCIQNPHIDIDSLVIRCSDHEGEGNNSHPWNVQTSPVINYPPFFADSVSHVIASACLGGPCPSLYRKWQFILNSFSNPESGDAITLKYVDQYQNIGQTSFWNPSWTGSPGLTIYKSDTTSPTGIAWFAHADDGIIQFRRYH